MDNLKPAPTPMVTNKDLHSDNPPIEDAKESLTLYDIYVEEVGYSVCLYQYMSSSKLLHLIAMKRVLCYLFGTQTWEITLRKTSPFSIVGLCDND